MIVVTTTDLEQADAAAEKARGALREAEQAYAACRTSTGAYEAHRTAVEVANHAEVKAAVLRETWKEQQAVRDLRAAEGEAAAREMAGDVEALTASRTAAVDAVVEARTAMGRALEALAEHDHLVRVAGEKLTARGLRSLDGELTGAVRDGSARIGGVLWPLIDGAGVLGHCLAEELAPLHPRHPLARPVTASYGGVSAAQGRDEVLAEVRGSKTGRNGR